MEFNKIELKEFLDSKFNQFNSGKFIELDPISIPHLYSKAADIEIAGFFAAIFAWGQRVTIIKKSRELLDLMDNSPAEFIQGFNNSDLKAFDSFVHRTFNAEDVKSYLWAIKEILAKYGSLQNAWIVSNSKDGFAHSMANFRNKFIETPYFTPRSAKHLGNPLAGSTAKRMCMYLRWMVRRKDSGIDLGVWTDVSPSILHCPLDVHVSNVSRKLGLLKHPKDDWNAVSELTKCLVDIDPIDPIKYDIVLFGLGVLEDF